MELEHVDKLVLQYLDERGYGLAAAGLREDAGLCAEAAALLPTGSLRAALDEHSEHHGGGKASSTGTLLFKDLEEEGDGVYNDTCFATLEGIHGTNIVAAGVDPSGNAVLTGAVDRTIKWTAFDDSGVVEGSTELVHTAKGSVLAIAFNPVDPALVLYGDMSGAVELLKIVRGGDSKPIWSAPVRHTKYVVKVAWSHCGRYFATASYDKTLGLYDAGPGGDCEPSYVLLKTLFFNGAVEAMAFSPACAEVAEVVIGARDDHRLHLIEYSGELGHRTINMNENGDEWVSFSPMDVSFSPDSQWILVSTDKDRVILYHAATGKLCRNFYGASNGGYSNPRHCWQPSGLYIYTTTEDHTIVVWELASQRVVATLVGHTDKIRDLQFCDCDPSTLVSTGFDKTVRLWRYG